jgi:hypothetical protein
MNVDRARFLLLTTALSAATAVALSASGCTVKNDATDAGTTNPNPTTDSGTDAYTADAYTGDSSTEDGGACLDDTGLAASCDGVPADCSTICQHYLPTFKKGVARSITACLVKLPTCEGAQVEIANCVQNALGAACPDPTAEGYCGPLSTTCGDADGGDAGMATLPVADCIDLASGLNDQGRAAFTACINDGMGAGYCVADPNTCIDTIE